MSELQLSKFKLFKSAGALFLFLQQKAFPFFSIIIMKRVAFGGLPISTGSGSGSKYTLVRYVSHVRYDL